MNAFKRIQLTCSGYLAGGTRDVRRRTRHTYVLHALAAKIRRLLIAEDGPTMVEYAMMLALIVASTVGAISSVGSATNTSFAKVVGAVNPESADEAEQGGRGWCP